MSSLLGANLLGYTILCEIGEGGMGKVYLAENAAIGQQVAIKVLDPVLARNPELRERFNQEARIQVALQHNNIVRIFNAQSSEELSFLVMEYIKGESLEKVLRRRGKFPVEEALKVFKQVLDAVGYAHEKGIIHRDIKPSNILVCADGTAKVTDFGIAKVLGDTKLTRTGTSMGSPAYMSPEQVLGKTDIDHRTDIYSLGATLYEILTGRPPFVFEDGHKSDSDFLVKKAHLEEFPADPRVHCDVLSISLSASVIKALQKDRGKRFNDCTEFISAINLENKKKDSEVNKTSEQLLGYEKRSVARKKWIRVFGATLLLVFGVKLERDNRIFRFYYNQVLCGFDSPSNCANIAETFIKGSNLIAIDYLEAMIFAKKACKSGVDLHCFQLAKLHMSEKTGFKNESKADAIYEAICSANRQSIL